MNFLKRFWFGIIRTIFALWYVIAAIIIGFLVFFIWGIDAGVYTGFGVVGAFTLYILGRSIWWFISGTGDYQGRNGLLKRLWNWLFKKP